MTTTTDRPDTRTDVEAGWAPLAVVLAGTFVTFLDFFIVNVALPSIDADLDAGPSALSMVVAGYGLTFAVGMITGGRLGDRYGRRRLFVLGLALFTLTSLACGVAPSAAVLVLARVLQGAAGALLTPQVLAIIATVYDGPRREKAFAAFGFAMGIAGVLGQLLGGALIQADVAGLGWRSIFLINVPIGLVGVLAARRWVSESFGAPTALDAAGTVLGTMTLAALVVPLVMGREHGWPGWTFACLAAVPVLAALFVAHQRTRSRAGRDPVVDPTLFRSRSFTVGTAVGFVFALVPPSFFFVLALYLQGGRGFDALFSGTVFIAVGVGYFAAMLLAARLVARVGHQVLTLGAGCVAVGAVLLVEQASSASSAALVPGLLVVGFGIGAVLVPLSSMVLAGVDPQHAGAAAGVLSTAQQIGGAVGVAVIGMVFFGGSDTVDAFRTSLWVLVALVAGTAALAQCLSTRSVGNV